MRQLFLSALLLATFQPGLRGYMARRPLYTLLRCDESSKVGAYACNRLRPEACCAHGNYIV